jgi:DNA-binding transcriptional MerR regulator
MIKYEIAIYLDQPEVHFDYRTAARLAHVSRRLVDQCEQADLITCRIMIHGKKGLCFADVQKLKLIRHFHKDLGLPLDAVDLLLHYRNRISEMQQMLQERERKMRHKAKEHLTEIQKLSRQLARIQDG